MSSKKIKKVLKKAVVKKRLRKEKDMLKTAVPIDKVKGLSFNTPNLFMGNKSKTEKRILIFTPSRGLVRIEWVQARYGQIIPTNWSYVDLQQHLNPWITVDYQLADAQNLMAKEVVEGDYSFVLYLEDDNVIPPDAFLRLNQYMNEQTIPVVSGLYFLKSDITEPLIYRGRGTSHFKDWKIGDKVWCDGIPFGLRLEHAGLIKAAWKESRDIVINGIQTREVFSHPTSIWQDPETGGIVAQGGTTDLEWCRSIIENKLLEKAGFPEYQKKKNPFLVDTKLFVKHIDQNGQMWPKAVPARFIPDDPNYKGKEVH